MVIELFLERAITILHTISSDILVYIPMLAIWFLFEIFYLYQGGGFRIRPVDILDNGVSMIYVSIMISPIVSSGGQFILSDFLNPVPRTWLSIILGIYAVLLIVLSFGRTIPGIILNIFGGANLDNYITLIALLYVDGIVPLDHITLILCAIPIGFFGILRVIRRIFS